MEICLTKENWWKEIDALEGMPGAINSTLKAVVGIYLHNKSTTRTHEVPLRHATPNEIVQAKEWLQDGIWIDNRRHELLVWVADQKIHRAVFVLVPCFKKGSLRRLSEL